jgi:DNA mismatch repair protein MutL
VLGTRDRDWGAILRGLLAADEDGAGPARGDLLESLTATIACKAAVKLGERLSRDEVQALLARRDGADRSHLCPHGRPTALAFGAAELERQFKR